MNLCTVSACREETNDHRALDEGLEPGSEVKRKLRALAIKLFPLVVQPTILDIRPSIKKNLKLSPNVTRGLSPGVDRYWLFNEVFFVQI